jgi:hypothetical protein
LTTHKRARILTSVTDSSRKSDADPPGLSAPTT